MVAAVACAAWDGQAYRQHSLVAPSCVRHVGTCWPAAWSVACQMYRPTVAC